MRTQTQTRSTADAIRARMLAIEQQLYTAGTLNDARRADLSMDLSELRCEFARVRKIGLWTADGALDSPEEE